MRILAILFITSAVAVSDVTANCNNQPRNCWSSDSRFPQVYPKQPCYGERVCMCSNTTANCSMNFGNLTFVPNLYRSYQVLNFSYNNVVNISHSNFFVNVSRNVRVIDLFNNGLVYIAPGAFRRLKRLKTLLLGGTNLLGYKDIPSLLSIPGLLNLDMSCLELGPIPMNVSLGYQSTVQYLDLRWNHIGSFNMSVLQPLRNLRNVSFFRNQVYKLETAYLPSLEILNLDTNRLFEFPLTCSQTGESMFPSLKILRLDANMIYCIDDPVCLPNLTELHLRFNHFKYFKTNTFSRARFPSLSILHIMQMENKIFAVEPFFINNSKVTIINFMLNVVDFSSNVVHDDAFGGCVNVKQLNLNGNSFQGVSDERFHRLLKPMEDSLQSLYLAEAQIIQISPNTFSRLRNLTNLYLYGNSLFLVPDGAFDSLDSLKTLILNDNIIATISESTFSPQLRKRFKEVDFGNNPFQCSCDILWFQQWMKSEPLIFQDFHSRGYRCSNFNNVSLPRFVLNQQACLLGPDAAVFTIAVTCLLMSFFLLFTFFFRFRWHLRLWLYEACRGNRRRSQSRHHFRYDVFVSYAEENIDWVQLELLPVLEGEWGLRLCIHQRDFRPGKHIVDNISDCVDESDRVLMVFSPHFASSEWCQFELRYCQSCVMERDDVMVLVVLGDTESRDMTGAMLAMLRTTTYIEWQDKQGARNSFWGRLRLALED